ncbi:hypothetical protein DCAR_0414545 [Daucus carota subsp. sativus]|uniref:Replication protein A 70 kDa DNA-binding subunit B/D first OB fold domain-containing protein n=1 Tax=Daucus carota subsp. sativus TaxID=79200 RepID=A0AAF1AW10_DAUCS|nr:hypothetical protein DCAR_0414545 [Daucus carota subsp. sativus]
MYDRIQNLEKSRNNWRIKARVFRFWPTFSPETSTVKGYNMILLDDDNSHVHAYVYPDNWKAFGKEVVEGKVYTVENFQFEFMDMGDLVVGCASLAENQNAEFAYDVIGAVEQFKRVRRVSTRYGDRDQTGFTFTDEENQIGALPSTRIYFNLNIDAVDEYRDRLLEERYKPAEGSHEAIPETAPAPMIFKSSFKELIENPSSYESNSLLMIKILISKVEEEDNWWFNSCIPCHAEAEKVEKKFKCTECNCSFGYCEKRFRIIILADDNTLATNVILSDRVVKRLACTTVANILKDMKKLSNGNKSGDSNLFNAVDICESAMYENAIAEASPPQASSSFSTDAASAIAGIESARAFTLTIGEALYS